MEVDMGDHQVTIGFTTKSWSFMTWMIWGAPNTLDTSIYIYIAIQHPIELRMERDDIE